MFFKIIQIKEGFICIFDQLIKGFKLPLSKLPLCTSDPVLQPVIQPVDKKIGWVAYRVKMQLILENAEDAE